MNSGFVTGLIVGLSIGYLYCENKFRRVLCDVIVSKETQESTKP